MLFVALLLCWHVLSWLNKRIGTRTLSFFLIIILKGKIRVLLVFFIFILKGKERILVVS